MGNNFWETEQPLSVDTGANVLNYFPTSKKLAVSKPNWTDKKSGESKRGKTVILDLESAAQSKEAVALLSRVLADLKNN